MWSYMRFDWPLRGYVKVTHFYCVDILYIKCNWGRYSLRMMLCSEEDITRKSCKSHFSKSLQSQMFQNRGMIRQTKARSRIDLTDKGKIKSWFGRRRQDREVIRSMKARSKINKDEIKDWFGWWKQD